MLTFFAQNAQILAAFYQLPYSRKIWAGEIILQYSPHLVRVSIASESFVGHPSGLVGVPPALEFQMMTTVARPSRKTAPRRTVLP